MKNLKLAAGSFGGGIGGGGGFGGGIGGGGGFSGIPGGGAPGGGVPNGGRIGGTGKSGTMSVFDPNESSGGAISRGNISGGGGGSTDIPVYTRILDILAARFEKDLAINRPHLVGLIFGEPYVQLVNDQIIPRLPLLNERSGHYIDFFTIGFSATGLFDAKKYNQTLETFQAKTNWNPSGGTDLILVNVVYDPATKKVSPNFKQSLSILLEEVIKVDGFENLGVFFERIRGAAKKDCGVESPAGVSNAFGSSLIRSATKGLFASVVPSGMQKEARAAFLFAVKDISKKR